MNGQIGNKLRLMILATARSLFSELENPKEAQREG